LSLIDESLRALQRGCFRYFQVGPVNGPVGLLAGLIKQPLVLVSHFFSVAFLAIWMVLCDLPLTRIYLFPYYAFMILYTACIVIVPYIWSEVWC
jgi:squalene monooxygenase